MQPTTKRQTPQPPIPLLLGSTRPGFPRYGSPGLNPTSVIISVNVVPGRATSPFPGLYIIPILSILGSCFIRSDGERWFTGVFGIVLPMPSTGPLRVLVVELLDMKERILDWRLIRGRRKSLRKAAPPSAG